MRAIYADVGEGGEYCGDEDDEDDDEDEDEEEDDELSISVLPDIMIYNS